MIKCNVKGVASSDKPFILYLLDVLVGNYLLIN